MWYNNDRSNSVLGGKKKFFSIEFLVMLILIALVFLSFWFLFYVPAMGRASVAVFQAAMKNVQTGIVMCASGEGEIESGNAGDRLCVSSNAAAYPSFGADCGTEPYFSVSFSDGNDWRLDTFTDKTLTKPWDCRGCRVSCAAEGCQETGECK